MKVVWMKTNPEGQTVFEDLEIDSVDSGRGFDTPLVPLEGVIFRAAQRAITLDYHNAPRRQFVICIGGTVEIESGDGTIRHIASGEALLADDMTGQGHKSRFPEGEPTLLMLAIPPDLDPAQWRA